MSVHHKIDKLIEEADAKVQEIVSRVRGGDIAGAVPGVGPAGIIPMVGNIHAGYKAGEELGHPVAGAILGQEGAAGAHGKFNTGTDVGDVYTKENMIKRAVQAGVPMAAISAYLAANGNMDEAGIVAGLGALGAGLNAGAIPGLRYGIGKLVGSNAKPKV